MSETQTNNGEVDKKPKMGRPTDYTEALSDLICERLAQGESMRSISRDPDMPAMTTLFKWLRTKEDFEQQYTKAKAESADALFEEILDIADDGSNDWMAQNGTEEGQERYKLNGEHYQRSRLRVDTRKWMAGKMKPKKYGDKQILDHQGEGITFNVNYSAPNAD